MTPAWMRRPRPHDRPLHTGDPMRRRQKNWTNLACKKVAKPSSEKILLGRLRQPFSFHISRKEQAMKIRVKSAAFGAPAGVYVARFAGVFPFTGDGKPRLGKDGKPMPPAIEWRFEIQEDPDHGGEHVGKTVGRLTSEEATPRNACGVLLAGLIGRAIADEEEIDIDTYVGSLFRVTVGPSKDNPDRTQVQFVTPLKPPAAPSANGSPPKRPPARAAKESPARQTTKQSPARYWVQRDGDGEPDLLDPDQIRSWLATANVVPA